MHVLLNHAPDIRIVQHPGKVSTKLLAPVDQLLLILPERVPSAVWSSLPQGAKLKGALRKRDRSPPPALVARLANAT